MIGGDGINDESKKMSPAPEKRRAFRSIGLEPAAFSDRMITLHRPNFY